MPQNGTKNLKPYGVLTEEEQKKLTSMGGKASGEARRKKKTLREHFEMFGEVKPNKVVIKAFADLGIPVEEDDTMLSCMFKWAGIKSVDKRTKMGDLLKFFEIFGKYTGQEPASKHEFTGADGQPLEARVKYITPESMEEIKKHIADTIKDV